MTAWPDFIGIGAQRAGTSWIYSCLYEHPEICAPQKELHFFSRERNWSKGFDWYEAQFTECAPGTIKGEFSTSYLTDPQTPRRIYEKYPNVKLLVSLRNPVDRAFSAYKNDLMAGKIETDTSFEEALKQHTKYVEMGLYGKHIENHLDVFPTEQLGIFIYEDSLDDPKSFIRSIYQFIGVDESFEPSMLNKTVNPGREPKSQTAETVLNTVSEQFQKSRFLRPLWWLLKKAGIGSFLRQINTTKNQKPTLSKTARRKLREKFRDDIKRLENITGKNFKEWKEN